MPEVNDSSYIVAVANSGLVIGSTINLDSLVQSHQFDIAIWGDDMSTPEVIEAAENNESFNFIWLILMKFIF